MGEIRFVGTGETRGYPYLVCKKVISDISVEISAADCICVPSLSTEHGMINTYTFNMINTFTQFHENK